MSALPDRAFLRQLAALAAAETLPRFRTAVGVDNKLAQGFDPVTEADRAAERVIRAAIRARFADHGIVGEEYGAELADAEHVWIIDPIDGTRAFVSGVPVWGTLVGLTTQGRATHGMMAQPFTGELFVADEGGAYLEHGGKETPLVTRKGVGLGEAVMFTTTPALFTGARREAYESVERTVRLARYGCDCYAYALLSAGHVDLVVETGLQSYDIAGLIPLIEKAGGVVTTWAGARAEGGGDIVAAGSPEIHAAAIAMLRDAAG